MRMWMVDPRIMCRQHLLGEWRELFTIVGSLRLHKKFDGYIQNDLLEPQSIFLRFRELQKEMISRGYTPRKTLGFWETNILIRNLPLDQRLHIVNQDNSLKDLLNRCPQCREIYNQKEKLLEDRNEH